MGYWEDRDLYRYDEDLCKKCGAPYNNRKTYICPYCGYKTPWYRTLIAVGIGLFILIAIFS